MSAAISSIIVAANHRQPNTVRRHLGTGLSEYTIVNRSNDISLSRANQSQAKFKSAVGGNLLQSWVNLTIVGTSDHCYVSAIIEHSVPDISFSQNLSEITS